MSREQDESICMAAYIKATHPTITMDRSRAGKPSGSAPVSTVLLHKFADNDPERFSELNDLIQIIQMETLNVSRK